jgi:hypothetical protein
MAPDTFLTLGDFEFSRFEIPEKIPFGGEQRLVVHELVGGVRVIDSMGRNDAPIEWGGLFQGETALERARYLNGLRIAGNPLVLTWDELIYEVVISSFKADFERFYQIPYRISCTVLQDLSSPITSIADPGIDDLIFDDMNNAYGFGGLIGDGMLSSLLAALDSAIRTVSSFATATQSTINGVLGPLSAVQARVRILTASVGNVVGNVSTLGGILPNNPISQQAAKLTGQVAAMTQLPQLYNLQSVLGRMGGNLGTIGRGSNTVTQAGGNLYSMAATSYKDPTAWTTIAKANNLSDPQLTGINTLVIPATPDNSGGVMSA